MTTEQAKAELMAVLGAKNEKAIAPRLKFVNLLNVCGRCGGSGEYSYCQTAGTTCFGCNGSGLKMPKITAALVTEAKAVWTAETAAAYAHRLALVTEAKRVAEGVLELYTTAPVHKDMEVAFIQAHGRKAKGWMEEWEWLQANRPELCERRNALYKLHEQIEKIFRRANPHRGTMTTADKKVVPLDWVALHAEAAPLLEQYKAANV